MTHDTSSPYRMLHLGLGSFHRAHQAVYMQKLHDAGDHTWTLAAGQLRTDAPELIQTLQTHNGRYTLETVTPQGDRTYTRIDALKEVIAFQEDLTDLVRLAADPATRIISFTVTEAGYYLDSDDHLDWDRFADLRNDLEAVRQGKAGHTLYGAMFTLLEARRQAHAGGVTLLNCDNLRHNGDRFLSGLMQFIAATGHADLPHWVQTHTVSPNAMVDRITPRPTPEVAQRVKAATGWDDPAALMAESFIQWVMEDRFIHGRPDWEKVGVTMVDSVVAYEEAKIRLLNATHSCIAWAGTLAGYTYIHQGVADPRIRQLAFDYVTQDAIPVLSPSPIDLGHYRDVVLDRFGNAAIADTNQRVAMDGFSKLPGMIVPTIRERLKRGESIDAVVMLPALFWVFLQHWHQGLLTYSYQDQAMDPQAAHAMCEAADPLAAFVAHPALWGDLANHPGLHQALKMATERVLDLFAKEQA